MDNDMEPEVLSAGKKPPCVDFARGECKRGSNCARDRTYIQVSYTVLDIG